MVDELKESAQRLLKTLLKKGADDAIVHAQSARLKQVKFANNKIAKAACDNSSSASVFVAKDGRTASTSLKRFDVKSIEETAQKLLRFTSSLQPNPSYEGIAEGPFKYVGIARGFDSRVNALEENGVDVVESAINTALAQGAERVAGVLEWGVHEEFLATSRSVSASQKGTSLYFSLRAIAGEGSGHKVTASRTLSFFDCNKAAGQAGELASWSRKPVACKAGEYDVVFDALPFSCLLDTVGSSASIFSAEAGFSFLAGKLGKRVASPALTLYDDATLENGFNSTSFDDEGTPSQPNLLIKDGLLRTFLHNHSTAKRYKTRSTASAGLVSPQAWNLRVKPGRHSFDELLSETRNGLYLSNLWYTRFQNYASGDFSTIPRDAAFLIKNGELMQPVKGMRVTENMLGLLQRIKALGRTCTQIKGWEVDTPCIAPSALIEKVRITRPTS